MTTVATSVSRTLLQEDWLDRGPEELEANASCLGVRRWLCDRGSGLDPISQHSPFRIIFRFPEFASCVGRITALLRRQWMKEQMAFCGISRSNQLGDNTEI